MPAKAVLSTTLTLSAAFAADTTGALAPGKPAGIKQAELSQTAWVLIGVGAVAAIAIGVASSSNGAPVGQSNNIALTTTTI